jgi:streptomycin 6-kinase
VLATVARRWRIEFGSLVQRGSMSVVIRCRTEAGDAAILKVSPDRRRIRDEAAALKSWPTVHVPDVLAVDESLGALLIEEIEPGTSLAESAAYPPLEKLAALMTSLHCQAVSDSPYHPVTERIRYLYEAGWRNYQRRPQLADLVPFELYERGRGQAIRLAAETPEQVLLHGDLTAVNTLDGGEQRGLVAIDPAPCLGDPAFDAIDLVLWQAEDVETITARAEQLAPAIGADAGRLVRWCSAFAAMTALEIAEASDNSDERAQLFVRLASAES